jgi:hypothetical protein
MKHISKHTFCSFICCFPLLSVTFNSTFPSSFIPPSTFLPNEQISAVEDRTELSFYGLSYAECAGEQDVAFVYLSLH